ESCDKANPLITIDVEFVEGNVSGSDQSLFNERMDSLESAQDSTLLGANQIVLKMDIIVATTLVTGQELDHTFNAVAKVTKRLLQLDWIVKIRHVYKKGNKGPFRPYSTRYSDTFVWLKFDCRISISWGIYYARKSPPTSTHHSDENLLGFSVKCIEDYLFLDFGCGGFVCGGKYGEVDVKGGAFQRNAHVSHRAAQRLWERRGSDQLSVIVVSLLPFAIIS
ncbi:hypothetical protein Godav_000019, partial [Gossypium davidsonii]|nr:hypothetical protein [Gossypium davidsonii]